MKSLAFILKLVSSRSMAIVSALSRTSSKVSFSSNLILLYLSFIESRYFLCFSVILPSMVSLTEFIIAFLCSSSCSDFCSSAYWRPSNSSSSSVSSNSSFSFSLFSDFSSSEKKSSSSIPAPVSFPSSAVSSSLYSSKSSSSKSSIFLNLSILDKSSIIVLVFSGSLDIGVWLALAVDCISVWPKDILSSKRFFALANRTFDSSIFSSILSNISDVFVIRMCFLFLFCICSTIDLENSLFVAILLSTLASACSLSLSL